MLALPAFTSAHVQLIFASSSFLQCAASASRASSIWVALLVALAARGNADSTAISMASG